MVSINSEDFYEDYDPSGSGDSVVEWRQTIRYWPALSRRRRPEWMLECGVDVDDFEKLNNVLMEIYGALDNDLRMLAAVGIRTAYDTASELLGVDPTLTFEQKLNELVDEKRIGPLDKDRLATIVDAGSASAHRGWQPEPADLTTMMDVLEHFIYEAFIAPARRKSLDVEILKVKGIVPPRISRSKRKTTSQG